MPPGPPNILDAARVHHRAGRFAEAESLYRESLRADPRNPETLHLLGLALAAQRRFAEAADAIGRATELKPDYAEAFYNLGKAIHDAGRRAEATEAYRRAADLRPTYAPAHNNLGVVLHEQNRFPEAESAYRAALAAQPAYAEAHYNLANTLKEQNRIPEAIESYRRAVALRPDYPDALVNLGNILQRQGDLDAAASQFDRAIALNPNLPTAHNSLGNAHKDAGRLDEALACYRHSIDLGGGEWAWDNLLYTLHFHPDYDARRIGDEHARWTSRLAPVPAPAPLASPPDPGRPLNVGYVSPDFREHPVGRFLLPLLANHDPSQVRVFCYADVRHPDALTHQLRRHAHVWRDTDGLPDDRLAALIREDGIDILVDLTMHMEGNRLGLFAAEPAPVQVTYLAYCSTTGLPAIDYRLTDPHLDPPERDESVYAERTLRLPRTYWCYPPPPDAPDVAPPPVVANGFVTFGCLNNYSKVTGPTWDMWLRVLAEVPKSRLLVHAPEGRHRQDAWARMERSGLTRDRLAFVARVPAAQYFAQYNHIDIALDPFPYGGGTTTCDALWMGVPVVTRTGSTAVSRGGASILANAGHPEWVSLDADAYVATAARLASDILSLGRIRSQLRCRLLESPLTDAPQFARDVEMSYRAMWDARPRR